MYAGFTYKNIIEIGLGNKKTYENYFIINIEIWLKFDTIPNEKFIRKSVENLYIYCSVFFTAVFTCKFAGFFYAWHDLVGHSTCWLHLVLHQKL